MSFILGLLTGIAVSGLVALLVAYLWWAAGDDKGCGQ